VKEDGGWEVTMKGTRLGIFVVGAAAMSVSLARGSVVEIRHEPTTCAPLDLYTRISARGIPAANVASAELQFRLDAESPWYSVRMSREGDAWSAFLPRPSSSLGRFEYRIEMVSTDGETASTTPAVVRVSSDPAGCAAEARVAVRGAIVVGVPPGAPVVPPVPPGFNPTGVVAEDKPKHSGGGKTLAILGGAALAGGIAAVTLNGGSDTSSPLSPEIPDFAYSGTIPPPGSVIHPDSTEFVVLVDMSQEPREPLTFLWIFEMTAEAGGGTCLFMSDTYVGAKHPTSLALVAPLMESGQCGERYSVRQGHLVITVNTRRVLDAVLGLSFEVEP
jgi:hypothetical protein